MAFRLKASIGSRIWQVAVIVAVAVAALAGGFFWSLRQTQEADRWVDHTQTVLRKLSSHAFNVAQAESAQRGYLITGDPAFLARYRRAVADRLARFEELRQLLADNPEQIDWARHLDAIARQRLGIADRVLALARDGDRDAAVRLVREGPGTTLMAQFDTLSTHMADIEKALLVQRQATLARNDRWLAILVIGGGIAVILILIGAATSIVLRIKRPLDNLLRGIAALGEGRPDYAVAVASRDEVGRVTEAFNQMAGRLLEAIHTREQAERELARANTDLRQRSDQLVDRGRAMEALGRMAHRLQAIDSDAEFARVVQRFAPQILPGSGGALYLFNNSRNLAILAASWRCDAAIAPDFAPGDCWALRRGQVHAVADGAADIVCHHLGDQAGAYVCTPLLAHGETVGLLYIERAAEAGESLLPLMAENVALALANFRLQQSLREQSIRDPLTGLFNRRYLEETLQLEVARAARSKTPLGVMMLDIDHFKRFNDQFGHDAGDALLRSVGHALPGQVRAGDVLCRYGGEELTIILPSADLELTGRRAEMIRQAVEGLAVRHAGQALGPITVSIGVATYPGHGDTPHALLAAADAALYRAKGEGRNRVVLADDALPVDGAASAAIDAGGNPAHRFGNAPIPEDMP